MRVSLLTHSTLRSLGWVTDDDATRCLIDALQACDLDVVIHEIDSLGTLDAVLRAASDETLFWGNTYTVPGSAPGEPVWLADRLAEVGVAHVGSGPDTLRLLIDKSHCQLRLGAAGIAIPRHVVIDRRQIDQIESILEASRLAMPVLVKPSATAGSAGIDSDSKQASIAGAARVCRRVLRRFPGSVLIEEFLPGPELTVGVIQGAYGPLVLATYVEIDGDATGARFLTERCRHRDFARGTTRLVPLEDPVLLQRIETLALRVCEVLDIRDITRMDCRLDAAGEIRVFDVNGMPGLCPERGCSVQQVFACFPEVDPGTLYRRLVASTVLSAAGRQGLRAPASLGDSTLHALTRVTASDNEAVRL